MSFFILDLKSRRFYFGFNEFKSNINKGMYFEGDTNAVKAKISKNKKIIFIELDSKLKNKIQRTWSMILGFLFVWFQIPLLNFLFRIIYTFIQGFTSAL